MDANNKAYDLETEHCGEYLHAVAGGLRLTPELAKAFWAEIAEECDELRLEKILCEQNFVETISMEELVTVVPELTHMIGNKKVAFVDLYHHDDISELGKILTRPSAVRVRIFDSADEAEKWLRAN